MESGFCSSTARGRRRFDTVVTTVTTLALGAPLAEGAKGQVPGSADVVVETIAYGSGAVEGGEMELALDLYRPGESTPKGAVILMHGGGFTSGERGLEENRQYGEALARRGYVAAAISYRLHDDAPVVSGWAAEYAAAVAAVTDPRFVQAARQLGDGFPVAVAAAAEDLVEATTWVRSQAASWGVEPHAVALFGASAGAISALRAAYGLDAFGAENVEAAAVIDLRGLWLAPGGERNPFTEGGPPLLILHGESDRRVPLADAEAVFGLAIEAGLNVELLTAPGIGHELGGRGLLDLRVDERRTVLDRLDEFLQSAFLGSDRPASGVRSRLAPAAVGPGGSVRPERAERQPTPDVRREVAEAVRALIAEVEGDTSPVAALYDVDKATLLLHDVDDGTRRDWSYWPRARAGLPLRHMDHAQRRRTQDILTSLLGATGYLKVHHIMLLEEFLAPLETSGFHRGAEEYAVSVFGRPSLSKPWAVRFEGHHVSLNVTLAPDGVSVTPTFLGASPAPLPSGPRAGFHPLAYEERLGFELLESLDATQRHAAVLAETAPAEILTTQYRVDPSDWEAWRRRLARDGVSASTFDAEQRELLERVVREVMATYRDEVTATWLDTLDVQTLSFAWMGPTERGRPHYFRIQGVDFVFELDAAQEDGSHVHTVWRDRRRDFGGDALERHYGRSSHR